MDLIVVKALLVRGASLLGVAVLSICLVRALWLNRASDHSFHAALILLCVGVGWAQLAAIAGAVDEAWDIIPCIEVRGLVLRHVELVWGPVLIATWWLVWVIVRRGA